MKVNVLVLTAVLAGALNAVWEWNHFSLYECSFSPSLFVGATLGDIGMVLGLYAVTALVSQEWLWASEVSSLLVFVCLSVILAVVLEVVAIQQGFWAYTEAMPRLHIFGVGVGVSPVLQLAITPTVSVVLASWMLRVIP